MLVIFLRVTKLIRGQKKKEEKKDKRMRLVIKSKQNYSLDLHISNTKRLKTNINFLYNPV